MKIYSLFLVLISHAAISAESALDYFPLDHGSEWVYAYCSFEDPELAIYCDRELFPEDYFTVTKAIRDGEFIVNGISTTKYGRDYLTNDSSGFRIHERDLPWANETYSPPIKIVNSEFSLGDEVSGSGVATVYSPEDGLYDVPFTYTSTVFGKTTHTVFAGTFETYIIRFVLTVNGNVNGIPVNETEIKTFTVAKGIGLLFDGGELVSTNLDDDVDTIADKFDNCPLIENKDQLNTDGDTHGDVCDLDDDNDGVLDIDDRFPLDPDESIDTDNDGTGNNADTDDDNDGLSDVIEKDIGSNPLLADTDNDGYSDLDEYEAGTDPNNSRNYPGSSALRVIIPYILNQ